MKRKIKELIPPVISNVPEIYFILTYSSLAKSIQVVSVRFNIHCYVIFACFFNRNQTSKNHDIEKFLEASLFILSPVLKTHLIELITKEIPNQNIIPTTPIYKIVVCQSKRSHRHLTSENRHHCHIPLIASIYALHIPAVSCWSKQTSHRHASD